MWERMELPSSQGSKAGFEVTEICPSMLSSPPPALPPDISLWIFQLLGKASGLSGKQSSKIFI